MPKQELETFISEAERALRSLRAEIIVGEQSSVPVKIEPLAKSAAALRNSAYQIGLHRVVLVLEALEDEFVRATAKAAALDAEGSRCVLDLISHAEAEVVHCTLSQSGDGFDAGTFVDRTFELLAAGAENQNRMPPDGSAAENLIDAELMEVFSQEADEILTGMEISLKALTVSLSDENAIWELRRHAHTFKGASGMVGLEEAARLAHRMEDLLDGLSRSGKELNGEMIELLCASVDRLRALTGDGAKIDSSELHARMEQFGEPLKAEEGAFVREPIGWEVKGLEPAEKPTREPDLSVADLKVQRKRPVVRVSIDRLDEVIKAFNEASRAGSKLERAVAELGPLLDSLERVRLRVPGIVGDEGLGSDRSEDAAHRPLRRSNGNEVLPEILGALSALEELRDALDNSVIDQRLLLDETQRKLNKIRLIRFGSLSTRLQRTVSVACDEEGRQAELVVTDPGVEVDTDVLDALVEPIMHLLRNAVAHGIEPPETRRLVGKNETGTITVKVKDKAAYVEVSVEDDGRGIDLSALTEKAANAGLIPPRPEHGVSDLLFLPGLTTAEKLTMNSGRGIGMSIVKESVESRGGSVTFETRPQVGSVFTVRVPSGPAAIQVLVANCGAGLAAFPSKFVKEVVAVEPEDIRSGSNGDELSLAGCRVPARYLSEFFGTIESERSYYEALIADTENGPLALLADHIVRTESVTLKQAQNSLRSIPGVLAAAVLSSGEEVPVLDPSGIFHEDPAAETEPPSTSVRVMVVDDSPSVRRATAKAVARPGFSVLTAADGVDALEQMERGPLPDLIVTDVEMPRMDGFRFAEAVRADKRLRHIPIVFITSRTEEEYRVRAEELGALDYLTKPFVESDLVGILDEVSAVRAGSLTLLEVC